MTRIRSWRKTAAGIWSDWLICAAVLIAAAAMSAVLGWHWAITGTLAAVAVAVCTLIALMWSIRNDLGDQDRAAQHRRNDRDMLTSARNSIPTDLED